MYIDALKYTHDVVQRLSKISKNEYFERKDRVTKYLIDEEWPLATFGKILYHPNRIIEIEYFGENHKFDAKIKVSGSQKDLEGWDDEHPVEITTAYSPKSYLVREEISEKGFSWGNADIARNHDKKVKSNCSTKDFDPLGKEFCKIVFESLNNKYKKQYPTNCIVLCAVYDDSPLSLKKWMYLSETLSSRFKNEIRYKTIIIDPFTSHYLWIKENISNTTSQ